MSSIFDKTTDGLAASINMRLLRQGVISSNIANAETPGYHAKRADFEAELSRALNLEEVNKMEFDHPNHFPMGKGAISRVKADVYEDPLGVVSNDGNTVDLETEMARLTENSILHKAALELINKKLAALRYSITEGRG